MNENPLKDSELTCCDLLERSKVLILYDKKNVPVNYTAKCLVDVCEHEPLQAQQCAILSKMKGNCDIASGSHDSLTAKRDKLLELGLKVRIAH